MPRQEPRRQCIFLSCAHASHAWLRFLVILVALAGSLSAQGQDVAAGSATGG